MDTYFGLCCDHYWSLFSPDRSQCELGVKQIDLEATGFLQSCVRFSTALEMGGPAGATQLHSLSELGVACQDANQLHCCKNPNTPKSNIPPAKNLSLPLIYSPLNKQLDPFSSCSVPASTGIGEPFRSSAFLFKLNFWLCLLFLY